MGPFDGFGGGRLPLRANRCQVAGSAWPLVAPAANQNRSEALGSGGVVVEDGHLAPVGVRDSEGATSLPSVSTGRREDGESTLRELLCPRVDLGGGIHPEADLQPVARGAGALAERELEAAELQVD